MLARAACVVALVLFGAQAVAHAQGGIEVLAAPPPEYEFGRAISFQLLARSDVAIHAVQLFIQPAGDEPSEWPGVAFEAGNEIAAAATFDLALHTLPPFADIIYWWELSDAAGARLQTPAGSFRYEDNRFNWHSLSDGALSVHWYDGDQTFGEAALSTALGALPRINRDIRAPLPPQLNVYIYASVADIQAALQRLGRTWVDGHADPTIGVVLVVAANDLRADFALQREIPHELTHILLYHATGANLPRVPQWLSEGLSTLNQGQADTGYADLLAVASDTGSFINLASLCGGFPADAAQARLAYAQSESLLRYVRARFGSEGIYALIEAYASGAVCEAGVQGALGLTMEELSAAWLRDAIYEGQNSAGWTEVGPWVVLTVIVIISPLGFLVFGRRRMV